MCIGQGKGREGKKSYMYIGEGKGTEGKKSSVLGRGRDRRKEHWEGSRRIQGEWNRRKTQEK
jgi:hypothetical protein